MIEKALDQAHAEMEDAPGDIAARMAFYHRLADTEVFLLLEREPEGAHIAPQTFDVDGDIFALIFDTVERLAAFAPGHAPYAAIPGRVLCAMLAPQSIGLGVNLDVAPSAMLMPPGAVAWLSETLEAPAPDQITIRAEALTGPGALPRALLTALDAKLARAAGLAPLAYLAGMQAGNGAQGHVLIFVDASPGMEDALARAVSEALVFSVLEAGTLDVGFVVASDPVAARLAKVGLRFDLPQPASSDAQGAQAPGMDPERPPILK